MKSIYKPLKIWIVRKKGYGLILGMEPKVFMGLVWILVIDLLRTDITDV